MQLQADWENYTENAGGKCFNDMSANLFSLRRHVLQHYLARNWWGADALTVQEKDNFGALTAPCDRKKRPNRCTLQLCHRQKRQPWKLYDFVDVVVVLILVNITIHYGKAVQYKTLHDPSWVRSHLHLTHNKKVWVKTKKQWYQIWVTSSHARWNRWG